MERARATSSVAAALTVRGRTERAHELWRRAADDVERLADPASRAIELATIGDALADSEPAWAQRLFDRAVALAESVTDNWRRSFAAHGVANRLRRSWPEQAASVALRMGGDDHRGPSAQPRPRPARSRPGRPRSGPGAGARRGHHRSVVPRPEPGRHGEVPSRGRPWSRPPAPRRGGAPGRSGQPLPTLLGAGRARPDGGDAQPGGGDRPGDPHPRLPGPRRAAGDDRQPGLRGRAPNTPATSSTMRSRRPTGCPPNATGGRR
jgi:hypothetical protein